MNENQWDFDIVMQTKVVALMTRDKNFMSKNFHLLKPYYFESEILVDLSRIITNYFNKYKGLITSGALIKETSDLLDMVKRPNPTAYFTTIQNIFTDKLTEAPYIRDKVIDFVRYQEYLIFLSKSMDLVEKRDYGGIDALAAKASKAGTIFDSGLHYFDPDAIMDRMTYCPEDKYPIGIQEIDDVLGGGLEAGELCLFLGPPNVGKSIMLTICGAGNLRQRKKVAHFSHEMNKKKIALRYDRNLLGRSLEALQDDPQHVKDFLVNFSKKLKSDLYLQQFPTRSATVNDLKTEIEYLHSEGFFPDVVMNDYNGIMKPDTVRERHVEIEEITENMRGLGGEFGIPVISAAQTTKTGVGKAVLSIEDFGESFGQSKVADIVIGICQTEDEHADGYIRLYLCKNRDEEKFLQFRYKINYKTMTLQYDPE